jgi:hypothetical protein
MSPYIDTCLTAYGVCMIGVFWFPPAAAICASGLATCEGIALTPGAPSKCCPKLCQLEPFDQPGGGCCDSDEHCVDIDDPNSRHGCCPSDQSVCAGKCCAQGESCCGDTCCPPNYFCRDGGFCSEFPSDFPIHRHRRRTVALMGLRHAVSQTVVV